ncbi:MAG: hypothetical protein RIR79_942 [Pseudomonadota bacterium]
MPVYSMTGYASAQHAAGQLGLEIRSVNSRFLDVSFRLSDDLRSLEPALRELVQSRLKRGKVEVRAFIESRSSSEIGDPSSRLLQRLNTVQDSIKAWLPTAAPLSVADVIRLSVNENTPATDWSPAALGLANQVLKGLMAARQREGERLCTMLQGHLTQLRQLAQQAVPLIPQLVEQNRQRFLARWKEAMALADKQNNGNNNTLLPETVMDRALTEATAFAIRIDVAEEITRLGSHLDEMERLLQKGGEVGKRLDFLIQELHREANTLGSKSAALELTHISVDMKVLIEQMREQVQNLE